jgi:hypothetical protein
VDRITTSNIATPEGVKPGVQSWRIWGRGSLNVAPVFTVPLANCGSLVCYTTGTSAGASGTRTARVAVLDANDQLVRTLSLGAFECRGMAAEPDGHFAALLWVPGADTQCATYTSSGRLYLNRYDLSGTQSWSTELFNNGTGTTGLNCPTEWTIGESRVEFGGSSYGAYYHVHSNSGHEGDTLKYVNLSGTQSTTWAWGCSHSMSELLRYSPTAARFMPACVTDCYPGTTSSDFATGSIGGIYINNRNKVIDVDGGCNGSVAGELGGAALSPTGWKIVYNAHQAPVTMGQSSYSTSSMNQDIGFASIAYASSAFAASGMVWLTTTSINEADSGIERWQPACDTAEQYVVGWSEPASSASAYKYRLARVDAAGSFLEGPVEVTSVAKWGRRDDPFRQHYNQDIIWSWFDASASTTLRFARLRSGGTYTCAAF